MKLRLKSNSIRIRLTKTEVSTLANTGYLEEKTPFINNTFIYSIQTIDSTELSASLDSNKITLFVPVDFIKEWPENDIVSLKGKMTVANDEALYLLVEKDFVCLDETTEDQSDNYTNPNSAC